MSKRILVIDGHPDPDTGRLCHALAAAYQQEAESAGHTVRRIALAETEIPFLRSRAEWEDGTPSPEVRSCQELVGWAEHLVIIYPLWLGSMPAALKAFFEQVFRPGFAIARGERTAWPGLLRGKSARIVVTMGMPAWLYRWFFFAHSLKSLERNILRFVGIKPVRETLIGMVESSGRAAKAVEKLRALGRAGE